jgi:hypothetical protein
MAESTAPILLTGAVSFGNQWLGNGHLDLRVIVATGIAAGGFALLEQVPGLAPFAAGVAWIGFITLLFIPPAKGEASPASNLEKLTGGL